MHVKAIDAPVLEQQRHPILSQKESFVAPNEHADAVAAYEHARDVCRHRLSECQK